MHISATIQLASDNGAGRCIVVAAVYVYLILYCSNVVVGVDVNRNMRLNEIMFEQI